MDSCLSRIRLARDFVSSLFKSGNREVVSHVCLNRNLARFIPSGYYYSNLFGPFNRPRQVFEGNHSGSLANL